MNVKNRKDYEGSKSIREWWARYPMTYGDTHGSTSFADGHSQEIGSREFFEQVDRTFYAWNHPLHGEGGKFARLFPYSEYRNSDVLEIGCGMGTMIMNWAQQGARITAVDLNPVSVLQCTRRLEMLGCRGTIAQADANSLPFADQSFDYVYSWGVLHHSPGLERSIREFFRVLRTNGGFGIMLYNRRSLFHFYRTCYLEGFLHCESAFLSPLELASRYTDGADKEGNPHTWPVTAGELRELLAPVTRELKIVRLGTELDNLLPQMIPLPKIGAWLPVIVRKAWARRWGWSLWITGRKL
jgi:ubiquinone/menaquinone biosynthesis C-methylase UbiE